MLPVRSSAAADAAESDDLIREALANRGRPYVWGGSSRGGFDCSGFVLYVFKKMRGINLPHSAAAQSRLGVPVARQDLQPGDLVFFTGTYRPGISHVGIYIGDNTIVHAASHKKNVRLDTLTGYYDRRYYSARRILPKPLKFSSEDLQSMMMDSNVPPGDRPAGP
jgi:peptidoglycan DL-endopeptidase CwlO